MTYYSAPEDGCVGEAESAYVARGASRSGAVFTACVPTSPEGKADDGEPAAHDDRFLPGLTAWASTIRRGGARASAHGRGGTRSLTTRARRSPSRQRPTSPTNPGDSLPINAVARVILSSCR